MTWNDVQDNEEITEIFYQHASVDDIEKVIRSKHTDKREKVTVLLQQFISGYQGTLDVLQILHSLIVYLEKHQFSKNVQTKLKWLECKQKLKMNFYSLCEETEMSGFPTFVQETIPADVSHPNLDKFDDIFHKVVHLMKLALQIPAYYTAFENYCKERQELHKYIANNVPLTDEMIGYVSIFGTHVILTTL